MNDRYGWTDREERERRRGEAGEGSHRSYNEESYGGESRAGQTRWAREDDDWGLHRGGPAGSRSDFDREQRFGGGATYGYGEGRQGGYGARQSYASQADQRGRSYVSSDYGYGAGQQGDASPQRYYTGQQQGFEVPSSYGAPGTFGASYGGGSGTYSGGAGGSQGYGEDYRERSYSGRQHERGFLQRASDEVASWFGDDDAARRREQDHRGRGPQDYTRSDERIREDANDRLTEDWRVDARGISVVVENGEVTLSGTVSRREDKRRAEDIVEDISGVKHVQNNLRVQQNTVWSGSDASTGASDAAAATSAAKTNTAPT